MTNSINLRWIHLNPVPAHVFSAPEIEETGVFAVPHELRSRTWRDTGNNLEGDLAGYKGLVYSAAVDDATCQAVAGTGIAQAISRFAGFRRRADRLGLSTRVTLVNPFNRTVGQNSFRLVAEVIRMFILHDAEEFCLYDSEGAVDREGLSGLVKVLLPLVPPDKLALRFAGSGETPRIWIQEATARGAGAFLVDAPTASLCQLF